MSQLAKNSSRREESPGILRQLPAVNDLVDSPKLDDWRARVPRSVVVDATRKVLDEFRSKLVVDRHDGDVPDHTEFTRLIVDRLTREERSRLRPVVNATGIILHTGLGRSPLAESVVQAVSEVARGYSSLELDLDNGERGNRTTIV